MYWFLLPLVLGFSFNAASAFTGFYSRRLGEHGGKWATIILRDVLGIPVWAAGYFMAANTKSTPLFNPAIFSSTLGWLLILIGAVVIFTGLLAIRWRAAAPSVQDTLVEQGVYAHIRHPLHSGMLLELIGLSLWVPKPSVLIACSLGIIWILVQSRLEEMDLVRRMPSYQDYMRRVPRFIPRLTLH